jgi:hypothetical protein
MKAPSDTPEEEALRRDLERALRTECVRAGFSAAVVKTWGLERLLRELRRDRLMLASSPDLFFRVPRQGTHRTDATTPQTAWALRRGWTLTKSEYDQC